MSPVLKKTGLTVDAAEGSGGAVLAMAQILGMSHDRHGVAPKFNTVRKKPFTILAGQPAAMHKARFTDKGANVAAEGERTLAQVFRMLDHGWMAAHLSDRVAHNF